MNKEVIEKIKNILENIENWINSPLDDIDKKYGIWEFSYKEATLLLKYIEEIQHQLEEKNKVIKKQSKIINKVYNNIENTYNWRKNHSTPSTIDVPLMTLCEEQLEILERGKNVNSK